MPLNLRNPSATRPWQHVLEPLWGYILLAENLCEDKNLFSQSYNFGPDLDDNLSVETVAEIALAKMHSCRNISFNKNVNFHESQLLMLDSTKAKLELGWRPRWSSQQAIGATCDWYLKANKGNDISELYQSQIESYFRSGKGQN
jgi:CDP-glucose 4,6-dehydratase